MSADQQKPGPNNTEKGSTPHHPSDASKTAHEGVHKATPDDPVQSRSADPGQSSYGGFKNEDPRKQAQDADTPAEKGEEITQAISGKQPGKTGG